MSQTIFLVLGASGFLGQTITRALLNAGNKVRAFDRACDLELLVGGTENIHKFSQQLALYEGSVFDEEYLLESMKGVEVICMFTSFSVPSSQPGFMSNELDTTLKALENVLQAMAKCGVHKIVFPSSGGTLYGETNGSPASEDFPLHPLSSYGMGKLLAESIIQFYGRVHGLKYLILRLSNPYGISHLRRTRQGAIDVFLQNLKLGEPIQIWGELNTVRDYLFIDDFADIFMQLIQLGIENQIINVGSGVGSTLQDIINCIAVVLGREIEFIRLEGAYSGLHYIVLDISRLKALTAWQPKYSLLEGIRITWARKNLA